MDFICPNCTKMITVPDQYAGQPMRCPICQQTFQAPSLPSSAPVAAMPLSDPPAPAGEEVYKFSHEPLSSPPPSSTAPSASPRAESTRPQPKASTPPPPTPPPAGYVRKFSIQLSPQVLPWIPAAALTVVFLLTFFNWVGMYPGNIGVLTQNAWQALYGGYSLDPVYAKISDFNKDRDAPGFSVLALFYLLTFFPVLAVMIAVVLATQLRVKLPPAVEQAWHWRFLVVAALMMIPLFFLLLQSLAGFPLEDKAKERAAKAVKAELPDSKRPLTDDEIKESEIKEGSILGSMCLHRTVWRSLAVLLHFLAPICALLAFWVERRGPGRPLPRFEALW